MAQPKRRAGESLTSYNRRLVAYYANRRTLENGFYDDEEDVDIRDLTAGSPATSNTKKFSRRVPDNRFYAEDRRKSSKPSDDRNIWDGYSGSNWEVDTGANRRPRRVAEGGKDIKKGSPVSKNILTPGDYTKNIGNRKRTALTPGDYTKNIGNGDGNKNKEEESVMDIPKSRRPRKYVGPGKGIEVRGPVTEADFVARDYNTGMRSQRVSKNNATARGIEEPATRGERVSNTFNSGATGYITENGKTVRGRAGQPQRVDEDASVKRSQRTNTYTTREGTFAKVGSIQNSAIKSERTGRNTTKAAGGGVSMRTGNSTREVLEDGFRKDRMKKSSKGIKP